MVLNTKKIMEDMGWSDGYHLPVANTENLKLEARLERLTIDKAKATLALDVISAKCDALSKHLKYIQIEQEENQNLLLARHSEMEAEQKLNVLAKMEREHLTADNKNLGKEIEKIESRKQMKHSDLNNAVKKLDKLKLSIEWDEETVEKWEELLLKTYEDNEVIRRFSKEDEKKAKDLEIKRKRLQEDELSRRQLVTRMCKELDSMEMILTRNVQLYRQMHDERGTLVNQWQDAVKHLQQRDKDTLLLHREILSTKELNDTKLEVLEQENQFLKNEINNNKELEIQIDVGNSEVAKLRKDLSNCTHSSQEYTAEWDGMKRELKKSAEFLQNERIKVKQMNVDRIQKLKALEDVILKVKDLKIQYRSVTETNLTANERIKTLNEIILAEETNTRDLFNDIKEMQGAVFRSQETLNNLREFWKLKNLESQGHDQGLQLVHKDKKQVEEDLFIAKEQLYKLNFRHVMVESKIQRLSGDLADDNYSEELEHKLEELEQVSVEVLEMSNLLQSQVARLEEVLRNLSNLISLDSERILKLNNKLQNQILLVDGAMKQVEQNKNLAHQLQVEENIMKVKLKYAEKSNYQEGSSIFNLQRQQLELELMLKERQSEIEVNKELLIAKRNAISEDMNRLKLDIQGRRIKIDHLKTKYESTLASIGKTKDGEMISVAYFKVKNAQEKYILQEEGDKLDGQIKKAEQEIIAMENTLKAVNMTNETYKKSVSLLEEDEEETAEMKNIENELYDQVKILRLSRNKLMRKQEELQGFQKEIEDKEALIKELEKMIAEKEVEFGELKNEAQYRHSKLERAETQIKKVINGDKPIDERKEKDFITRQLQDYNKSVLQQLSEISIRYLETEPNINRYLSERNITLSGSNFGGSIRSYSSINRPSTSRSSIESKSSNKS